MSGMLQHAYEMERDAIRMGWDCSGKGCPGWRLTDFDTWEACGCGAARDKLHPYEVETAYEVADAEGRDVDEVIAEMEAGMKADRIAREKADRLAREKRAARCGDDFGDFDPDAEADRRLGGAAADWSESDIPF